MNAPLFWNTYQIQYNVFRFAVLMLILWYGLLYERVCVLQFLVYVLCTGTLCNLNGFYLLSSIILCNFIVWCKSFSLYTTLLSHRHWKWEKAWSVMPPKCGQRKRRANRRYNWRKKIETELWAFPGKTSQFLFRVSLVPFHGSTERQTEQMNDRSSECMFARKQQTLLMHRATADISFSLSTQTQPFYVSSAL